MKNIATRLLPVVFLVALFAFSPTQAHAANLFWVGTAGADASVASNWRTTNPTSVQCTGNAVAAPTSADNIFFDPDCNTAANWDSSAAGTVAAMTFGIGYTSTVTLNRSLAVTGTFTQADGTLDANGNTFTTNIFNHSAGTFTAGSGVFTSASTTISGGMFNASSATTTVTGNMAISGSPTLNQNGGVWNFGGTGGGSLACGGVALTRVTFTHTGGSKTISSGCDLNVGNNPLLLTTLASLSLNTGNTIRGTGTITTTSTDPTVNSLNLSGGTLVGFTGLSLGTKLTSSGTYDFSNFTTFTAAGATFQSGANITLPTAGATFTAGVTINSGATLNASSGTTTIPGTFTLNSGGTFNSSNGTLAAGGAFTNNGGTFNAGTGTVDLNGTSQTITGNTTFYNLTKTGGTALTFAAGSAQTIQNSLFLHGTDANNLLSLVSDTLGSPWTLAPQATADLRFLNISDLNNTGAGVSAYDSTDGGGNTNVNFLVTATPSSDDHSSRRRSGGTHFGCKDPNASNYEEFAASDPSLCTYGPIAQAPTVTDAFQFLNNLKTGVVHSDVMELQKCLNKLGFTVASTGPGSSGNETMMFGAFTREALRKFQEAHAGEVLTPIGLTSGTGVFAEMSRKKMNEILATDSH